MERRRITTLGLAMLTVVAVAVLLWVTGSALASPPMRPSAQSGAPMLLNYQGRLTDPGTGDPKPDGVYNVTFNIYNAGTDGNLIWSEAQAVTVSGGLFNVLLGSVTALSVDDFDGTARWLELVVEGETLNPRVRIVSTPYAIQAEEAKNAWRLTGNAGTTPGTNFLGTTDGVSLTLAVSNTVALRVEPTGGTPNLIGGHINNTVTYGVVGATIGGGGASGGANSVTANYATVGGGEENTASGMDATVGGGEENTASGKHATVGGGWDNTASGTNATVGGGYYNKASGIAVTVGGGRLNKASGYRATVGGGYDNTASGPYATVGGGRRNTASGDDATVGGGYENTASGAKATVPGGRSNKAAGNYSFAAGRRAKASHNGAFVWGDSTEANIIADGQDIFLARANGGFWFGAVTANTTISRTAHLVGANTFISTTTGAYLSTGGAWTDSSDGNAKENFAAVDGEEVLAALAQVPIQTWNYKAEDPSVQHMGPTAQDFYTAFGLGDDDRHIAALDTSGVALAAIQALAAENAALREQVAALDDRVAALEAQSRSPLGSWGPLGLLFGGLLLGLVVVRRNDLGRRQP
jgi:hypothetical protein